MFKILKRILAILLLAIIFISNCSKIVTASIEMADAYIEKIGEINYHLKYYKEEKGISTYCTCAIVGYHKDGTFYPAYCLNRDLHGVGVVDNYTVDVDSILDNNQVWRAVTNGYPYKTASQMGLANDFDAFAVTKFAIYCLIGQADINLYTADEGDAEGQAMLNALHTLVDIGKNGSSKFSENLKINKISDLKEDGNYFSITYGVSADQTVSNYTIKSVTGLQNGDLITDENGNIKTNFTSNEKFKIKISKDNLNSNKDINIEVEGKLKSNPIFYGKTRIAGTQNYLLTASSYKNTNATANLKLNLNTGILAIKKVDADTKEGLGDVEFELYNSKNEFIQKASTDKNGNTEFKNLFQGKYYVKETKAKEEYILEENPNFEVDVSYNKTSSIEIENKHKTGNLEIFKTDKDSNTIALGNVGFELYNETNKLVGTYYTDANGKIEVHNLRTGNYLLKEIETNEWYNLAEDRKLQIKWNETAKEVVEDELKKGQIKVIKVDKENNQVKIPNVEFEVLDVNGNFLEKITTDENGEALTNKYALRDYSKIRLHETKTDSMYELNEEVREVTLEENQIKDVIFENEKIKGKIQIVKQAEEKSDISGLESGAPLEGVKFEVYDEKEKVVDTITTNAEGIALTKDLLKGKYKVKEIETNKWYLLDESFNNAEISKNKEIITINIKNKPAKPEQEIEKTGPEKAMANEQIKYNINVKNTGNVELNNFIWEDEIPVDYIAVTKIKLGTYNQEQTYNLYYKSNITKEYVLLYEDINTTKEDEIDLTQELVDGEYITGIKLDFGTVNVGFSNNSETAIFATVNSNVKNQDEFENKVTLTGNYKDYKLTKESKWKTSIYKLLPLTGM